MAGGSRRAAVVLVDHGSRAQEANSLLERVAERVRERLPGRAVHVAHMEIAQPSLAEALEACAGAGETEVVVLPYFLAPGRHGREDIPRLAAEAAGRHPGMRVRVAEPLGLHDGVIDALLARLADA